MFLSHPKFRKSSQAVCRALAETIIAVSVAIHLPVAASAQEKVRRPPADAFIAAAKAARLAAIDDQRAECGDQRTVAAWLDEIVRKTAKSVRWTAAACQLTDPQVPIDAGGGPCAQARITPKKGTRGATVEIYFEGYDKDGPGSAFAFRSLTQLTDDENYSRTTGGFEYDWRSTQEPGWQEPEGGICGE